MSEAPNNASLDGLYMAVGKAISNWTVIEIQLHQLFAIATRLVVMQPGGGFSYDSSIPAAVLDSIDGFRSKLMMIDAALNAALANLDDEAAAILNEWAVQRKKVNTLHGNRSILAHWTANRLLNPDGQTIRVVLKPPIYSSREHEGITETDVKGWNEAFENRSNELVRLVERLASHRGLQRKHLERAANQALICLPADPTLLEYLKQLLSEHL